MTKQTERDRLIELQIRSAHHQAISQFEQTSGRITSPCTLEMPRDWLDLLKVTITEFGWPMITYDGWTSFPRLILLENGAAVQPVECRRRPAFISPDGIRYEFSLELPRG